jgi:hypothetical protein
MIESNHENRSRRCLKGPKSISRPFKIARGVAIQTSGVSGVRHDPGELNAPLPMVRRNVRIAFLEKEFNSKVLLTTRH